MRTFLPRPKLHAVVAAGPAIVVEMVGTEATRRWRKAQAMVLSRQKRPTTTNDTDTQDKHRLLLWLESNSIYLCNESCIWLKTKACMSHHKK